MGHQFPCPCCLLTSRIEDRSWACVRNISPMELSKRFRSYIELAVGDRLMNPPDEFLKHAADCEQMAKFTRDSESMATWNRMAERWRRCAEIFTSQNSAARHQMPARPHRHPVPGWAHH